MTVEREFVKVDGLGTYDDDRLEDVIVGLERESLEVLNDLRAEMAARAEAALERAKRVGAKVAAPGAGETAAPGKRGRKSKEEKQAEEDAKAAAAAKSLALESSVPAQISGRA